MEEESFGISLLICLFSLIDWLSKKTKAAGAAKLLSVTSPAA
jgi:hypothetical protein